MALPSTVLGSKPMAMTKEATSAVLTARLIQAIGGRRSRSMTWEGLLISSPRWSMVTSLAWTRASCTRVHSPDVLPAITLAH